MRPEASAWLRRGALALPFVIGVIALRLAVAPLGDATARSIASAAKPAPPPATAAPPSTGAPISDGEDSRDDVAFGPPRRIAARAPVPRRETLEEPKDAGAKDGSPSDAPKATIVVPASAVTRAMERRDVGATNATAPDGSPLGARLAGVSRYRTGLRDGDVVVAVAGTRTPTVDAMVAVAMQAASSGATRLSGRIVRGDSTFAVVLELPK